MYDKDFFKENEYFRNFLNEDILDSLTQVISRKYMLGYVQYLIEKDIPFSMGIMDVDNFKMINDTYGHSLGDLALSIIAERMVNYVGDMGVVGRFGGDEFVFVYLGDNHYQSVYEFAKGMYGDYSVVRNNFKLGKVAPFITATIGTASYPLDAQNFEELFTKADKALYRGKTKGRNCYIIYVHDKHKDIEISKLQKQCVYEIMDHLSEILEDSEIYEAIPNALLCIANSLRISGGFYLNNNNEIVLCSTKGIVYRSKFDCEDIERLFRRNENTYEASNLIPISNKSDEFNRYCIDNKILAVIIKKIAYKNFYKGYIALFDSATERIWQEDDKTLLTFLEKIIGHGGYKF